MRNFSFGFAFLLLSLHTLCGATCYTVHSPQGKVVYQSSVAPIDLSQSISSGMNSSFPGHSLVMSSAMSNCHEVQTSQSVYKGELAVPGKNSKSTETANLGSRDLSNYFETKDEMYVSSNPAFGGSSRNAGTDVTVKGYMRANGTYVSGHTRAASGGGKRGK